jgi:hypothetical protein
MLIQTFPRATVPIMSAHGTLRKAKNAHLTGTTVISRMAACEKRRVGGHFLWAATTDATAATASKGTGEGEKNIAMPRWRAVVQFCPVWHEIFRIELEFACQGGLARCLALSVSGPYFRCWWGVADVVWPGRVWVWSFIA